jgi:S1-C subfamily serine protease
MKEILGHNVRVLLYDGQDAKKTASGVVVGTEVTGGGAVSYVMTNAHALDAAGMKAPDVRVIIDRPWEGDGADPVEVPAEPVAIGEVPQMDLALLRIRGVRLQPAEVAVPGDLIPGDAVVVASAPFGRSISLSGGLVSAVEWDRKSGGAQMLKTDAAIGYGASGGGIYSVETGRLLAIVEGYRTARVGVELQKEQFSFDVPMPGETFAAPATKVRAFLQQNGFARLLDGRDPDPRTAAR